MPLFKHFYRNPIKYNAKYILRIYELLLHVMPSIKYPVNKTKVLNFLNSAATPLIATLMTLHCTFSEHQSPDLFSAYLFLLRRVIICKSLP